MPFKQGINPFYICNLDLAVPLQEMSDNERDIYIRSNCGQLKHIRTMIKRAGGRQEHLLHHMPFATGKNEMAIPYFLNVSTQQGFNILFRIFGDLLKLVDRHDTGFVSRFQITKNLIQRILGTIYIT